ncbi:uncharacterized protein LOC127242312 [Andrographis paniculata]|uniref:uncharacterized protein LOC127242312 n=1 Tax=Andrographis paniculata TaxID=175694 RepID=UPI0021E8FFE1|nr:uncharacterized protein LOC127242312 [Andrographis paniculata]
MAEEDGKNPNGEVVVDGGGDSEDLTLWTIFNRFVAAVLFPGPDWNDPLLTRIRSTISVNVPLLREASKNTVRRVIDWTRRGSPFRALFVVCVGLIGLLVLTGLSVFMLFFIVATFNAIVISLLVSLAAAGGFLALFFTFAAAIYIGALSIAVVAISTATISAAFAVFIATGWIGFFFTMWLAVAKSIGLAKRTFSVTGSAVSAYSTAWQARHQSPAKKSD